MHGNFIDTSIVSKFRNRQSGGIAKGCISGWIGCGRVQGESNDMACSLKQTNKQTKIKAS
jgi:hypothetical protein